MYDAHGHLGNGRVSVIYRVTVIHIYSENFGKLSGDRNIYTGRPLYHDRVGIYRLGLYI